MKAIFFYFILKIIFLFWFKMTFDYFEQPSLRKIKTLKHYSLIQLWNLVAAKLFVFHTQKPTGWKKLTVFVLKESYNFVCGEFLEVILNFMMNGCRQLLL